MHADKKNLFGRDYFESAEGLRNKRIYNWDNAKLYFKVLSSSINNVIKPGKALDIGCAKGYLAYLFKELGIDVYGVDVSSYAISCAPAEIKDRLFVVNIEQDNLPFPAGIFDLITITEVLEHLDSFDILMQGVRNVLKNGGYVFITTPTPFGRYARTDKTHINIHFRGYWIRLFRKYGLILVRDHTWRNFKIKFLREFRKIMPDNPPSTGISASLKRMGKVGNGIRNNFLPYIDYFSPFRSDEILLFRRID
ncbi:MAG: class I SAM-dependent methyltransferase [Candidatus Omnitrophica bacterium]|nr:class I SAM-dependent methyltransferase [Candidatus Omnitrophota bacterium]